MSDLDTAKTILGARMRLRNSDTVTAAKARPYLGERETQEISDQFRAHPGREGALAPSHPADVDHGEFK